MTDDSTIIEKKYEIEIDSDVIIPRNAARSLAEEFGFSKKDSAEIAIAVSELAANIAKYAAPGFVKLRIIQGPATVFEVVAEDHGRGIVDIEKALKDEYTDSGPVFVKNGPLFKPKNGIGCGLPAVERLMDDITIESVPMKGTRISAKKNLKVSLR